MAWIKNQDNDGLHNINSIWLDGKDLKGETHPSGPEDFGWLLGSYDSKELAINELDGIERWLESGGNGVYNIK